MLWSNGVKLIAVSFLVLSFKSYLPVTFCIDL